MKRTISITLLFLALASLIAGCAGEDYTPVYFPPQKGAGGADESKDAGAGARRCTLTFAPQLCVAIKGKAVDAGTEEGKELCTEVPPFPIHVEGTTIKMLGSEFPDIEFEGAGLPLPITINGRGNTDGTANVGDGTVDAAGNMTIKGFSFFIVAAGAVGKVADLTFTTGTTDEMEFLPAASGSPPDASGAMKLVAGTTLGSVIEAADKYLLGASLVASFTGSITPSLSQCGGEAEKSFEVKKLVIDEAGHQTESGIPEDKYMEVSSGTYVSESEDDIGSHFEALEKFRVRNISTSMQTISIPPVKGPFLISSAEALSGTIKPGQSFVVGVTFRPTTGNTKGGTVYEAISIGPDQFMLEGHAVRKSGSASMDIVDGGGAVAKPDVEEVEVGNSALPANTQREFFLCSEIDCSGNRSYTDCHDCKDPVTEPCELLPVSTTGRPMGEVNAKCELVEPDATPLYTIDLKGTTGISLDSKKQVIALRNKGTNDLIVKGISIVETEGSKSTGQFALPGNAVFLAKSFADVSKKVAKALAGDSLQGTTLPVTLPPFEPGYREISLYIVVTYVPSDLIGSKGEAAGVGSKVEDKAKLIVKTDTGDITTEITGTTTIQETPALELYFKTSTGTKSVSGGKSFPFKGVSPETIDLAVPLFLRTADTAKNALRVKSITIEGGDAANFQWLDTEEKINLVNPPTGKGMRCSIPIVDETTGQMTDEEFDLKPVSLAPNGFVLVPGAMTLESMPLFGCVNFHRDANAPVSKRIFSADITIAADELDSGGNPIKNPDGSYRQTTLTATLKAAINPKAGPMVFRVAQTMAAILNPNFPGISAISAKRDVTDLMEKGIVKDSDFEVFTGALVLDPFDEMTIKSTDGLEVISTPNDGTTAIFRRIDTHPISNEFENPYLYDYASLIHNSDLPIGSRGVYEDYPNVPEDTHANGWRIFTGSLSYPGPIPPPGIKNPEKPSDCEVINPCSPGDLKKFTQAGVGPGERGACTFFYASGGRYDSPAYHFEDEMPGGERAAPCSQIGEPQNLKDVDTGRYSVDGRVEFEEVGFSFFGPTYYHNPGGPLGNKPPVDEVFHMGFTTGMIKPPKSDDELNIIPDEKINLARGEFKINLDDPKLPTVPICKNNIKNRKLKGKIVSSWRYLDGLLFKDEDGTTPAGCPEDDNNYTGGSAYLRGRDVDHETGEATLVAAAKFSSNEDLSFAFKDVMLFVVLNGWMCDPAGSEDNLEGGKCFDLEFNERDAASQIALTD